MCFRRRASATCLVALALVLVLVTGAADVALAQPETDSPPVLRDPSAAPEQVRRDADRITDDLLGSRGGRDEPERGVPGQPGEPGTPVEAPGLPFDAPAPQGAGPVLQALMWVVLVGLAGLAVWLVVRAVLSWRRGRKKAAAGEDIDVEEVVVDLDEPVGSADEWLERAVRAEAAGDWREGVRCRFRSLVATMANAGMLDDVAGRTSGELRVEASQRSPGVTSPFAEACGLFELAWYGGVATGPGERDRFEERATEVRDVALGASR